MPPSTRKISTKEKSPPKGASRAVPHVAFLRGINVGGKRKLPMTDLAAMFVRAGSASVRTYIQSGNVVFAVAPSRAEGVCSAVLEMIADRFRFEASMTVRTGIELAGALDNNPFAEILAKNKAAASADPELDDTLRLMHVGFLADDVEPARVARLDPDRSPGDRFAVQRREIYLYTPNGMADTRLTSAYFDSTLGVMSTFRNLRTVQKLIEMTQ